MSGNYYLVFRVEGFILYILISCAVLFPSASVLSSWEGLASCFNTSKLQFDRVRASLVGSMCLGSDAP